jgi:regulatory protein
MTHTPGGRITKIEPQKKNPKRVSIFIDDQFALGVDQELLLKFNLSEGVHLSREQLESLEREESLKQAKDIALRSLSRSPKSTREISKKLKEKGFQEQIIDVVIRDLEKYGYLNDTELARVFSESCLRTKPLGPRLLREKLYKKGLNRELIEATVEQFYQEHEEAELAGGLLAKRRRAYEGLDPRTARKRKADYLARRGFSWEAIKEALDIREDE